MGEKKVFKYPIIIEKATGNYSAYSPDLPGCIATGSTIEETFLHMRSAIEFHIKGLESEGIPIPEPSAKIKYVEISV
jgi:predicted RNase H-like HicB family nuclease